MKKRSLLFIILFFAFIWNSCGGGKKKDVSKIQFAEYVRGYTGGVISTHAAVRVRLAKTVAGAQAGKEADADLINLSPPAKGKIIWEDDATLIFKAKGPLDPATEYTARLDMEKLFPGIDPSLKIFEFGFKTLKQNYDLTIRGIKNIPGQKMNRVALEGQIQTADVAPPEQVRKMIRAEQDGRALEIEWQADIPNSLYMFTVKDINRREGPSFIRLAIDGTPIGVDEREFKDIAVPALDDFSVLSTRVISNGENYISVQFSDPPDERQNLKGLVRLSNTNKRLRLVINGNELRIYPAAKLNGSGKLTISRALKNQAGFRLKKDFSTSLLFEQIKPGVRFVNKESSKAILPSSNGLLLPFEAVSLRAVDVTVVRIFENNILQYLQENDLGESSEIRRVGRPVIRKTIALNSGGVSASDSWKRFSLNLEELISAEPGAMYQVRIGFRRSQALYRCGEEPAEEVSSEESFDQPEEESSAWDNYEYYYAPDYNWRDRDNPCTSSYYGRRRDVSKILFASDLALIAKRGENGPLTVYVSNILDTDPVGGAEVEVYDYQRQLLGRGRTDAGGMADIALERQPFVVLARHKGQTGYLKVSDGASLSLSNFDVSGTKVKKGLKGFIYGERGVWRPADTLHIGFILEDKAKSLPANHPVIMELYNPENQLIRRKVSTRPVGNIYRFDFVTAAEAPTGRWMLKARVGGTEFVKNIRIETIKPNRLKIDLKFKRERFTAEDRQVSGDLNVRWLSGATARNLKVEYDMMLKTAETRFEGFPGFTFDDRAKILYGEREQVYSGRLDDKGHARVNISLSRPKDAPGALTLKLFGRVYEEGGDFSISSMSIPYYPFSSFVGLKTPEGDKRGMLLTDKDHNILIASVDGRGRPLSRKNLKVELFKVNWRWWWDNSYDNIANYVASGYREPVEEGTVNTRNGKGTWKLRVNYPQWGRYYLRVTDPRSGHSAGKIIYMDWPGWAGKGKRNELNGATMLDFSADKKEYTVGETIKMAVPSTAGNRILVSLETGSRILDSYWVKTVEGQTPLEIPVTAGMAPNVYVHLSLIQPHRQIKRDLPLRLYGVQSFKITDPSTTLKPQISLPQKLAPEESYEIRVSEASGKAMAYTLAVVDEGLLDITRFKTPDPWSGFFAREALGVKTWDVYDRIIGYYGGRLNNLLAIGGDGDMEAGEENRRNRFKPVVRYLGPFFLEAGETARHRLKMPQYVGSVKTMLVAAADGAYGHAEAVTPVTQPLMILATLPRVAGPGEELVLPVNLFAMEENIGTVRLKVETSGALKLKGAAGQTVRFSTTGDTLVNFTLTAQKRVGAAKVKVTALAGALRAAYDIDMQILPRNAQTTLITEKVLAGGESWQTEYRPLGLEGRNRAVMEFSIMPPLNLEQRLGYLIRYPHGCIEQTVSAAFAQLWLNRLTNLTPGQQDDIQSHIRQAIQSLKSFQLGSGGFSYWPGQGRANLWGSSYAGHFLIEAQNAGYVLPDGMLLKWSRFQRKRADSWQGDDHDNDLSQAYRLYTLALAAKPALGAMNRMKEEKSLKNGAAWRLALAYALAGYTDQAARIVENRSPAAEEDDDYRFTYGSPQRDQAMILETLVALGRKKEAFGVMRELAAKMSDSGNYMSTQTTAYTLVALGGFAQKFPPEEGITVTAGVNGKNHELRNRDFISTLELEQPDRKAALDIRNEGNTPVFARLLRSGIPLEGREESRERNIKMEVRYLDARGKTLDVGRLKQGTTFSAEVTVRHTGLRDEFTNLALTQIFPSGWEIINTRLDGSGGKQPGGLRYRDIRDDRVMDYFDLKPGGTITLKVMLNAAYRGRYYLPGVHVEAMYDPSVIAVKKGRRVEVISDK